MNFSNCPQIVPVYGFSIGKSGAGDGTLCYVWIVSNVSKNAALIGDSKINRNF